MRRIFVVNIFKVISDTISSILKKHKTADPVNKHDILALIENNLVSLQIVVDTYNNNTDLFNRIRKDMLGANKDNDYLQTLYDGFVKGLSSTARNLENTELLKSVAATATILISDHQLLRDRFDDVFKQGTDPSEITLEQMRLSHAVIFGFINLSSLLADWFCFFIGQINSRQDDVIRVPSYRLETIRNAAPTVSDFVSDTLARGSSRSILTIVQSIRTTGDVALYTTASTLDSYASINDYPGLSLVRFFGPFNSFQPILWLRERMSSLSREKYKKAIAMRDWIQAKIVVLQMDANKMDPNSPEYQRQKQILQRYSNILADYDRKIADYEQS